MFIELSDAIRICPISINTDVIEAFYDMTYYFFDEESDFLLDLIEENEITPNAVIEVKNGRIFVEETYEEIRNALNVRGMLR